MFSAKTQSLYGLNTLATFVLFSLDQGIRSEEVAQTLPDKSTQPTFGTVVAQVAALLAGEAGEIPGPYRAERNGANVTDTGELIIFQSGIAITLAPDCYDSTSFRAALTAVGASVQAERNGIVIVDILGGFRVALRFSNFGVLPVGATASSARAEAVFPFC